MWEFEKLTFVKYKFYICNYCYILKIYVPISPKILNSFFVGDMFGKIDKSNHNLKIIYLTLKSYYNQKFFFRHA